MSWGEYITNLQGQGLKQAVIAGQDGSWIQSSDAAVSIKLFVFSLQSLYCYLSDSLSFLISTKSYKMNSRN